MRALAATATVATLAHLGLVGIVLLLDSTVGMYGALVTWGLFAQGEVLGGMTALLATLGGCGGATIAAVYSTLAAATWGSASGYDDPERFARAVELQGRCLRWMVGAGWAGWTAGALFFAWATLLG